jgi:hypothetical protein
MAFAVVARRGVIAKATLLELDQIEKGLHLAVNFPTRLTTQHPFASGIIVAFQNFLIPTLEFPMKD